VTPGHDIAAIAVIIPAHDEEELLDACLRAVAAAVRSVRRLPVAVFLVLDACTDLSAVIAGGHDVTTVVIEEGKVGAARAAGAAAASAFFSDVAPERVWTAHTDADSVVPPHWLSHQLDLAAAGADVVVGTVHPDLRDLDDRQRRAWLTTYEIGVANGAVHGANLGIRSSTLAAAGGFAPVPEHEDVMIVDRARLLGAKIVASAQANVITSGRSEGRTPGGYARYLREDLVPLAASADG